MSPSYAQLLVMAAMFALGFIGHSIDLVRYWRGDFMPAMGTVRGWRLWDYGLIGVCAVTVPAILGDEWTGEARYWFAAGVTLIGFVIIAKIVLVNRYLDREEEAS